MKKETIVKSALLSLMMMVATGAKAQTKWKYSYDNAGNRVMRQITTNASARQKTSATTLINEEKVNATSDIGRNNIKVQILSLKSTDIAEAAVYDLAGKRLLSQQIESEVSNINLRTLNRGTYILTIVLNGETNSCKFNK